MVANELDFAFSIEYKLYKSLKSSSHDSSRLHSIKLAGFDSARRSNV